MNRGAIAHKGRDWAAPLPAWAEAIDQMLSQRDAGRLELPMKGHGYLFAILAGMADRHEAAAEKTREEQRRAQRAAHTKGAPLKVTDVVPGLVPLALPMATAGERVAAAAPPGPSPTVRAMLAEIERAKAARANPSPQSQGADQ